MPRQQLMSWEGHPYYRWVKMHKGVRYRVSCDDLKVPRTKEDSTAAANEWWLTKRAGFDSPIRQSNRIGQTVPTSEISVIHFEHFEQLLQAIPEKKAKVTDRSVKATAERFLELQKGSDPPIRPKSFREIKEFTSSLYAGKGPLDAEADVKVIDEELVEKVYLWLSKAALSSGTKKKRWAFFTRYVKYLWGKRLIELPRNLGSHGFKVQPKNVKKYRTLEVRECLASLKPRLKLYALLGLNCGMTNVDIGQLRKDMIDLDSATLTRKRVKTQGVEGVPTVTYKLWPETLKLLRECWSAHDTLALTSKENTPLWVMSYGEGDTVRQKDLVLNQWRKKKRSIPLKAFRSISATLIESHPTYGRLTGYFLGHSPKSVKERHYAAPPQELFDATLSWLREQLFS